MANIQFNQLPILATPSTTTTYVVVTDNRSGTPTDYRVAYQSGGGGTTPFTASIAVSYTTTSLPWYNSTNTSTANWTITANATPTAIAGTISDGTTTANVTTASGTTAALRNTGLTIGGSVTGTGTDGVSRIITLSGTVPAIPVYTPALYAQPAAGNTPPTFTTASLQTSGAALGSSITYNLSSATTNYGWIAIPNTLALNNLYVRTQFGDSPLVPDITAPNQTISGQVFLVFGFTNFSTAAALTIVIK